MIPLSDASVDTSDWQRQLAGMIRSPKALLQALDLSESLLDGAFQGHKDFPIRVPKPYLERIEKGNPEDPLLLQVLPVAAEMQPMSGYVEDPLEEAAANPAPGIVHKYHGRVLLLSATSCAVHCRYCFRRHFPYSENRVGKDDWQQSLEYIRTHPDIREVILSGGDPWIQTDRQFFSLLEAIEALPQITRLRVHTRLPIVIPDRVTQALADRLKQSRLDVVVVLHANHANELDEAVARATLRLKQANVWLLNQSVLMKGVNDNVESLAALSERLFHIQVMPYYLHVLDKVKGAAHFHIDDTEAASLHLSLQKTLPGYLVPKLVRELPGRPGKTWISVSNHHRE